MENHFKFTIVMDLWKMLKSGACPYTTGLLHWQSRVYFTRKVQLQLGWRPRVLHGSLSFINQAVQVWNDVDVAKVRASIKDEAYLKEKIKGIMMDTFNNFLLPK